MNTQEIFGSRIEGKLPEGAPLSEKYMEYSLGIGSVADAIYTDAISPFDAGNAFIEALPHPRMGDNITLFNSTTIPYGSDAIRSMTRADKLLHLRDLRKLRFPLQFHSELEFKFYEGLTLSYGKRIVRFFGDRTVTSNKDTITNSQPYSTYGDVTDGCDPGIALLGYSGSGKSSAIKTLLSHYPQVIRHSFKEYPCLLQITYLVVQCEPNDNLSATYLNIAHAVDVALGHNGLYEGIVAKKRNAADRLALIRSLIEKFSVGAIILDEVENLNFKANRQSSYQGLMTLANETKVLLVFVGTEQAYGNLFTQLQNVRRFPPIDASGYCSDIRTSNAIIANLFKYQFFENQVTLVPGEKETADLLQAFHDCAGGIIGLTVGLYEMVNFEAIKSKKKQPVIDASFVHQIAEKYYGPVMKCLDHLEDMGTSLKNNYLSALEQLSNEEKLIASKEAESHSQPIKELSQDTTNMLHLICKNISVIADYPEETLTDAARTVLSMASASDMSERDLTRETLALLKKRDKKPSKKHTIDFTTVLSNGNQEIIKQDRN